MRRGRSRPQEKALTHLHLLRYKQDIGLFPFVSRMQTVFYEVVAAVVEVVKALNAHTLQIQKEKKITVLMLNVQQLFPHLLLLLIWGPKKKKTRKNSSLHCYPS